jgi:hypothetical protein
MNNLLLNSTDNIVFKMFWYQNFGNNQVLNIWHDKIKNSTYINLLLNSTDNILFKKLWYQNFGNNQVLNIWHDKIKNSTCINLLLNSTASTDNILFCLKCFNINFLEITKSLIFDLTITMFFDKTKNSTYINLLLNSTDNILFKMHWYQIFWK